jgi:ATPase subunit of ABC transporter with duplicated ATPase domains
MFSSSENPAIVAKNIAFTLPSGEILFENLDLTINSGDKIALIGKNGTGKSTLMKILAGTIESPSGTVSRTTLSYLDQLDEGTGDSGNKNVLGLLTSADEDWWQLQTHYEKLFEQPLPDINQDLKKLSGGEYMKLKLAVATFSGPEILLLDEPTNHLDTNSKEVLQKFIMNFSGGVMIISHDIDFINQVASEVWELEGKKLAKYGGNYEDYLRSKAQKDESRQKRLVEALKEVDKSQWALIREEKRAAKSKRHGVSLTGDRGMSRIEKGFFKNKASTAEGKIKEVIKDSISEAKKSVEANATSAKKTAKLDLYEGENQKGRILLDIRGGAMTVGDNLLLKDINFEIKFGERVLLTGDNGSGKTCLIKAILGQADQGIELVGEHVFRIPNLSSIYISQRYDQVDKTKSLIENMFLVNSKLDMQVIRRALGNLLFKEKYEVEKQAGKLSGGETARLAFAMASISPTDLLILDEPTNNLDIETVNVIIQGLKQFSGAILVVSHDINFIKQIGVTRSLRITDKKLLSEVA